MPKTSLPIEPIEIEPGNFHLFLTVKIGVKKARLLLDTGASRTAFDLHRFENFAHRNKQDHQEINSVGLGSNEVKTHLAQINTLKPKYTSPVTICHEMAHQLGYASENECNFIGFMAAWHHKDLYFKYSASTFAVTYCLYHLELMKNGSSKVYKDQLNKGVLLNFEENRIFWQQHQTVINDFFTYFYDRFLKMNQQKDGMESYSKFMSLLLHYNLKYSLVTDAN
ncbi:MAG: DUF3810 family protein [Bacteroidetes bacterium]|nr:DUF3810 family protein [Bacteroidota bacterium]